MRLRLETDIFANVFLLLITICYILSPYVGFGLLLVYLLFAFISGKTFHMIAPMIYLAINSAIGGSLLFAGVSHLQIMIVATFFVFILRKKIFLGKMINWLIKSPLILFAIALLIICCIRTGSGLIIFCSLILMLLIIVTALASTHNVRDVFDAIIVSSNQVLFLGVIEFLMQRTFFYSSWTGEERYRYGILRVGSTVSDPNYICLTIIPIALLVYYLYKLHNEKKYLVCFIAYLVLCVLTMSRIGMLGLLFVLFWIVRSYYFDNLKYLQRAFMNMVGIFLGISLLMILLSMFLGTENSLLIASNFTRTITLKYGTKLFLGNFWNGLGLHQFYNYAQPLFYRQYGGHFAVGTTVMNMPLEIAIAFGVPGLVSFGLLIGSALKKASNYNKKILSATMIGMLIVFLCIALTLDAAVYGVLWIIIALPFGMFEKMRLSSLSERINKATEKQIE